MILTYKDENTGRVFKWNLPKVNDYENYPYSQMIKCPRWYQRGMEEKHVSGIDNPAKDKFLAEMEDGLVGFADTPMGLMLCHVCTVCGQKWKAHSSYGNDMDTFKEKMAFHFFINQEKYKQFQIE